MARFHGRNAILRLKDKDGNETAYNVIEWAVETRGDDSFLPVIEARVSPVQDPTLNKKQ